MSLSQRPHHNSFGSFRSGFDRLFRDFESDLFGPLSMQPLHISSYSVGRMNLDLKETNTSFEMTADIPGVTRDEITVNIDDAKNTITFGVEGKEEVEKDDKGWIMRERSYGKSQRTVALPQNADLTKTQAVLKDGVLSFTIPKREIPGARALIIN